MIVEVVAVGTELLLGQTVNTNLAIIGAALADHGFDSHHQVVVGDNRARLAAVLRTAIARADAVIVTGGLGPTRDDLTREALGDATGLPLVVNEDYAGHLRQRFAERRREMPQTNLRQAEHPEGATLLHNPKGTAPGLHLMHAGTNVFCIPGVPEEMEHLLFEEVLPILSNAAGSRQILVSRLIRTWGLQEAMVGELLDDLYQGSVNPSIAFLASAGEIKVRISAKVATVDEASALIEPIEREIRARLGDAVFGVDDETVEAVLLAALQRRRWSIASAESMTGGLVAARLTSIPGASAIFKGAVVAYTAEAKREMLGLAGQETGLVSVETAEAMAKAAQKTLGVEVAVAVTGSAGPEALEKPVGTAVIAVATPTAVTSREMTFPGDRERVRAYAAAAALHLTRRALDAEP